MENEKIHELIERLKIVNKLSMSLTDPKEQLKLVEESLQILSDLEEPLSQRLALGEEGKQVYSELVIQTNEIKKTVNYKLYQQEKTAHCIQDIHGDIAFMQIDLKLIRKMLEKSKEPSERYLHHISRLHFIIAIMGLGFLVQAFTYFFAKLF